MSNKNLSVILGIKLKQLRKERKLSLKELAALSGLSISYLNEIEKGKKYPKAEKIAVLAEKLGTSYDYLVSQQLGQRQSYLKRLIESEALEKFPFHLFGMSSRDILQLIPESPKEGSALMRAILNTTRGHDLKLEDFYHTALRCYQEMRLNYFEEIEEAVDQYRRKQGWAIDHKFSLGELTETLRGSFGYEIDFDTIKNTRHLSTLRSISTNGKSPRLLINSGLSELQQSFVIAREIAYQVLDLKARSHCSPDIEVQNFDQVLNAFLASYFASALFINTSRLCSDLKGLFSNKKWDPDAFLHLIGSYHASPESFFYRLSEVLPRHFQIKHLHFLRFDKSADDPHFRLTKQLNMSDVPIPTGIDLNEHFCRRWLSVQILQDLKSKTTQDSRLVGAQVSRFLNEDREFLCLCVARPLRLSSNIVSSLTIGFKLDSKLKRKIAFWEDPSIPREVIGETCERCPLTQAECPERAAEPLVYLQRKDRLEQRQELHEILNSRQ